MGIEPTVRVEQATTSRDIRCVAPLFDEYRVFYGQTSDIERSQVFLLERWLARESIILIAINDDDAVVGFLQLYPLFLSDRLLRFWLLNDLYVRPAFRRTGIARRLMNAAEELSRDTGSGGLALSTAVNNYKAQSLYESLGYVLDGDFVYYNLFFSVTET